MRLERSPKMTGDEEGSRHPPNCLREIGPKAIIPFINSVSAGQFKRATAIFPFALNYYTRLIHLAATNSLQQEQGTASQSARSRLLYNAQATMRHSVTASLNTIRMVRAYGATTIKAPSILFSRKRYLLLLSHGRCYTSLLSHILGSHPDIIGSSETFDSYVKSSDLLRLRFKKYWQNEWKANSSYVFDKVLGNFPISDAILNRHDVRLIFTLRKPAKTIQSMIKASQDLPTNVFWKYYPDAARCCEYYVRRLKDLEQHCLALRRDAIYFDAEDLLDRTPAIFEALKTELNLSQDLSEEYRTFNHTGVSGGDYSPRIVSGRISRIDSDHSEIVIPENVLEHAQETYERCRSLLRERCVCP